MATQTMNAADIRERQEFVTLASDAEERRTQIAKLQRSLSDSQRELTRLRDAEKVEAAKLATLSAQRDEQGVALAQGADPRKHDAIIAELARARSRVSGLGVLIRKAAQSVAETQATLTPLATAEYQHAQHLAAQARRKELAKIVAELENALSARDAAAAKFLKLFDELRGIDAGSAGNREYALMAAEELGRKWNGITG